MSHPIRSLEPRSLWNHFADLNAIPRPSKGEDKAIQFMKEFGEGLGLTTMVDAAGNVIIKKPATPGMEDHQTVVMQGHLDMVHQKNEGTDFDFATQGIDMFIEQDWLKARGTTLGADNGIGVAATMAILSSTDIPHPAIEALFTIDEEAGMSGALSLESGLLDGTIMLNLDTEEDTELTIGCAGGVDVNISGSYQEVDCSADMEGIQVAIKGLKGGHSGLDIHLGLGNANKLLNRLLHKALDPYGVQIASISGGSARNAIPREANAIIALPSKNISDFTAYVKELEATFQQEYATTDPNLHIQIDEVNSPEQVMESEFAHKILRAIYACDNGIYRMSPDVEDLVQTSNNLSIIRAGNGQYAIQCLTRSSVDSERSDQAAAIAATFELIGSSVEFGGAYPGWAPKPSAPINALMVEVYEELFGSKPHVAACHAGLECGIIGGKYPGMDMISFGPNIRGAHSPDERVQISSVQKVWKYLVEVLGRIPKA